MIYYLLAFIGLVATWYFNLKYLSGGGGLEPDQFFGSAFANYLTSAITVDVYLSALVFSIWTFFESKNGNGPKPWLFIVMCFAIGLAIAFPLYLARKASGSRTVF
ncbi:MAG: DUF2834 domain-containing protein [Gallionella sp.]|nr:DUF2834 domain-containing protein [Gallionella sp.]